LKNITFDVSNFFPLSRSFLSRMRISRENSIHDIHSHYQHETRRVSSNDVCSVDVSTKMHRLGEAQLYKGTFSALSILSPNVSSHFSPTRQPLVVKIKDGSSESPQEQQQHKDNKNMRCRYCHPLISCSFTFSFFFFKMILTRILNNHFYSLPTTSGFVHRRIIFFDKMIQGSIGFIQLL